MACKYIYNGESYTKSEIDEILFNLRDTVNVPYKNYTQNDESVMRQIFGVKDNTLEEYLQIHYNEQFNRVKKLNPTLKFKFDENNNSSYDPGKNIVSISLSEIYARAGNWDHDINHVLSFFMEHEIAHAITTPGLQYGGNMAYIEKLFNKVKELHLKKPFVDKARGEWVDENGLPYALMNIYEFSAEAYSNPYFAKYLQSISNGSESFLDKIINFFRELLGLSVKDSIYDDVMNLYNSEEFADATYQELYIEESTMQLVEPQYAAFYWLNNLNILKGREGEIDDGILKTFNQIPAAISKLKKELRESSLSEKQAQNLSTLIDKFYEISENKDRIATGMKMLDIAFSTANSIKRDMVALEEVPVGERLLMLNVLIHQANSLDFIVPLILEVELYLAKTGIRTADTDTFSKQLAAIRSIKQLVNSQYAKLARPTLIKIMGAELGLLPAGAKIIAERNDFQKRLNTATDPNEIKLLKARIEDKDRTLDKLPIPETLEKAMAGKLEDASLTDLNFQAIANNSHPIVQALSSMITRKNIALSHRTLQKKNRVDRIISDLLGEERISSTRDIEGVTDPIRDKTTIVIGVKEENGEIKRNAAGEIEYETEETDSMLSDYDTEYKTEVHKLRMLIDYYYTKRDDSDGKDDEKYANLIEPVQLTLKNFIREHSEREWEDVYYLSDDIIDEELSTGKKDAAGLDIKTSLRKERGELFEKIADAKARVDSEFLQAEREEANTLLTEANREFQELSSLFDKDGYEKKGVELLIAEQAIKYTEARKLVGERKITPEDQARFDKDKALLEENYTINNRKHNDNAALIDKELENGKINQKQHEDKIAANRKLIMANENEYKIGLSRIQVTKLTDAYYEKIEDINARLDASVAKILLIDELAEIFNKKDKELFKAGYSQLRQMSKPYRDSETIIDGIAFQRNKPESVLVIKEIQQALAKLSEATESFTSLSKNDKIRFEELERLTKSGKIMSDEDRAELINLVISKEKKAALAVKYAELLDDHKKLVDELRNLSESEPSHYYEKEKSSQLNLLRAQAEIDIRADFPAYVRSKGIIVEDGKFYVLEKDSKDDGVVYKKNIVGSEAELIAQFASEKADLDLPNSEWWKNNHYTSTYFDINAQGYISKENPIYIWVKQTPTDEAYIVKNSPSLTYTTFIPNENLRNPRFKLIGHNLAVPKASSRYSGNKRYRELSKPYLKALEALRALKYQTEEDTGMGSNQKTYDLLPSIPKTVNENKINMTTSILNGNTWRDLKSATLSKSDNEDVQFAQHGSLKKSNVVPYRFNHSLKSEQQSKNIFAMILMYDNANMNAANMKELEPIFEAADISTKDLNVLRTKNVQGVFKMKRLLFWKKNNIEQKTVTETIKGGSVLNLTIQHMLDTFVHGESKTEATFNSPLGEIDAHKLVGDIKSISARAIFAGKIFSPIKNSIAGKLNALINANIGQHFATKQNYVNGTMKATKYMPDLIKDYKKLGNRSFIGQTMDYFQVLHGGVQNEFGKDIQWSVITETGHYLTFAKHISEVELQLSSFLAISEANKVKLKDGRMVDFHEAFEIKDGEFKMKDGAEMREDAVKHFIDKIAIVNRFINGAFRAEEKSKIEKHPLGSMFYFLNGFVMPGIKNRYGKEYYSVEAEMVMRGYYKEAYKFAKDYLTYGRDLNLVWGSLNVDEQQRVLRFVKEVSTAIALAILGIAMGSGDKKKVLAQNSGAYNYLLALTMATASEVQTFIPFPGLGGDEILRKIKTPFAAVSQVGNMYKLFTDFLAFTNPFDPEAGRYLRGTANKDGLHDEGDAKFIADFAKFFGWNFSEFDSLEKVQNIKQLQTIRP